MRIAAIAVTAALAGATALGGMTAADATTPADSASNSDSVLRIATDGYVDTFNPFLSIYLTPTNLIRYEYENLVQQDQKTGAPTKGLAESWKSTQGGKTWTFTLQKGLQWSDGKPLTSKDVQWTYQQMMKSPTLATANGNLIENFKTVEAPDARTVVIHLKTPQAPVPGAEIPVLPEHVWSKVNAAKYPNNKNVVGSGPFVLSSYKPNQSITLRANPKFWRGKPKISGLQYTYYTNSDAQVQALKSGEVDFVSDLLPTQFNALKGESGITTHAGHGRRYQSISINSGMVTPKGEHYGTGNPALQDQNVRQAMRMGIDSKTLLKQVIDGYGLRATSFITKAFTPWNLPENDKSLMPYDPKKARAKLDAAGWKVGSGGIRAKNGKKLSLRLYVDSSEPTEATMAQYLKPWMKNIGIQLKVISSDSDTISSKTATGDYDLYFSGWSVNADPDYQLGINTCANMPNAKGEGGTSQDGYCNKQFDKLYAAQHSELNQTKRVALVHQMLRMNYTYTAQIALWYPDLLEAYRSDRFTGFGLQPNPGGIIAGQDGYWGFLDVRPVPGASAAGSATKGVWIVLGVIVVVVAFGSARSAYRRRNLAYIE